MPGKLAHRLRGYQRAGVAFLFRQYAQGIGGILGDDMVRTVLHVRAAGRAVSCTAACLQAPGS